jgi:hypothetical protein
MEALPCILADHPGDVNAFGFVGVFDPDGRGQVTA